MLNKNDPGNEFWGSSLGTSSDSNAVSLMTALCLTLHLFYVPNCTINFQVFQLEEE